MTPTVAATAEPRRRRCGRRRVQAAGVRLPDDIGIGLRNLLTGESATLRDAEPTRFELDDGTFTFSGNVVVTKGPFPFARMRGSGIREQFGFPGRRGGATVSSVRLA